MKKIEFRVYFKGFSLVVVKIIRCLKVYLVKIFNIYLKCFLLFYLGYIMFFLVIFRGFLIIFKF